MAGSIRPDSKVGRRWAAVKAAAPTYHRGDNIYQLYPTNRLPHHDFPGPHIYLVLNRAGDVAYVGQTKTSLRQRFRTHLRDPAKRSNFTSVAAIALAPDTPARIVDELERQAQILMSPKLGTAWPRTHASAGR